MADARPTRLPPMGSDPLSVAQYVNETLWNQYVQVRRSWLRQVEENVRALAGRQFDAFIDTLGEFVDLSTIFAPNDDRWRRTPVFNWLAQDWYPMALAKLTENVPLLGAMPATADAKDATTAEVFDPVWKYEWRQMAMPERIIKAYGWILASGRMVLKLRWDPTKGPVEQFYGPGTIHLPDGDTRELTDAPYTRQADGSYGVHQLYNEFQQPGMTPDGEPMLGAAAQERLGDLSCDVVSPTSVLQPYGPELPHEKPWTLHEYLLPLEEVESRYGRTDVKADQLGLIGNDLLLKMEYTSAYGMPSGQGGFGFTLPTAQSPAVQGLVRIRELWHQACRQYPTGRLTICTLTDTLYDDVNPYVTSERSTVVVPFYIFDKPGFPFRQEGSSDLENLIPVARAFNRSMGGQMDAQDYNEQPTLLLNRAQLGDDQDEKFGLRGGRVYFDPGPGETAKYLETPGLPEASVQMSQSLMGLMRDMGHVNASQETVPNDARSGELLAQSRFDTDRPWGTTLRLHSYGWERFGQGIMDILAVCMEDERVLAIAGEDNAAKYLTVRGELFQGQINVLAMPESAVIESKQEKQRRMTEAFTTASALLPPYNEMYLKALNYTDLVKMLRPGGEAYSLATRQLGEMCATGQLPPIIPEQDHATHISVVTEFMQTLAYRSLEPPLQNVLRLYRQLHQAEGAMQAVGALQAQAGLTGMQQHLAQVASPQQGGAAPSAPGAGPTPASTQAPPGPTPGVPSGGH